MIPASLVILVCIFLAIYFSGVAISCRIAAIDMHEDRKEERLTALILCMLCSVTASVALAVPFIIVLRAVLVKGA